MSTYRIYFTTGASTVVEVEADDLDSAIDLAYDSVPSGVCAQCAGWGGGPGIELGDDWEADEKAYWVDDEYVETSKATS